jgi:hypothetical protein
MITQLRDNPAPMRAKSRSILAYAVSILNSFLVCESFYGIHRATGVT